MEQEWYRFTTIDCGKEEWLIYADRYSLMTTPALIFIKNYAEKWEETIKIIQWLVDDTEIKKYV